MPPAKIRSRKEKGRRESERWRGRARPAVALERKRKCQISAGKEDVTAKLEKPGSFSVTKSPPTEREAGLSDRHIKTPLNCEIEHSVKIDLTFPAYRSLPRVMPKFLDNCFIIGFTSFPVAILTSSEEAVISKGSLTAERSRLASRGAPGLGVLLPAAP